MYLFTSTDSATYIKDPFFLEHHLIGLIFQALTQLNVPLEILPPLFPS